MRKIICYIVTMIMVTTIIPSTVFADSDCNHVWSDWEYEYGSNITCCEQYAYRYCEECYEDEEKTILATTDHNWDDWVVEDEATCIDVGYKWRYCNDCDEYEEVTIPATGIHDWGDWEYDYGIDVTCCEQDAYRYCWDCDEYEEITIPATTDHIWGEWDVWWEPTCEESGFKVRYCTICEDEDCIEEPATGIHKWGEWDVWWEPTCEESGFKVRYCTICEDEDCIEEPATGIHKWGEWDVWEKATIEWDGSMYRECEDCYSEQEKIIKQIGKITISCNKYIYDGKAKLPTITVKDTSGNKLNKGTDYTVQYKNSAGKVVAKPKAVGKYRAIVTFKGNYSGTVTKYFTINPKATAITKLTKGKKQFTVKWTKRTAQVTGYEIQYSTTKAFTKKTTKTVKVKTYKTNTKTIKNLKAKKKYWVKVRTYKTVNGKTFYSTWTNAKPVTTK